MKSRDTSREKIGNPKKKLAGRLSSYYRRAARASSPGCETDSHYIPKNETLRFSKGPDKHAQQGKGRHVLSAGVVKLLVKCSATRSYQAADRVSPSENILESIPPPSFQLETYFYPHRRSFPRRPVIGQPDTNFEDKFNLPLLEIYNLKNVFFFTGG